MTGIIVRPAGLFIHGRRPVWGGLFDHVAKEQIKTTKSRIYKALRRAIITGRYRPEERLLVETIASEFGTSVAPVRDALQMLGQEGLVTIRPRSGYFVTHMTLEGIDRPSGSA